MAGKRAALAEPILWIKASNRASAALISGRLNSNVDGKPVGTAAHRPKLFIRWLEPSGRLFEYKVNKFDAKKKILDSMGDEVQPNEVRPDKWIMTEGFDLPGGVAYESLILDPRISYIVGVTYDEDGNRLAIETDRNQFADAIIQRLTRGV